MIIRSVLYRNKCRIKSEMAVGRYSCILFVNLICSCILDRNYKRSILLKSKVVRLACSITILIDILIITVLYIELIISSKIRSISSLLLNTQSVLNICIYNINCLIIARTCKCYFSIISNSSYMNDIRIRIRICLLTNIVCT